MSTPKKFADQSFLQIEADTEKTGYRIVDMQKIDDDSDTRAIDTLTSFSNYCIWLI